MALVTGAFVEKVKVYHGTVAKHTRALTGLNSCCCGVGAAVNVQELPDAGKGLPAVPEKYCVICGMRLLGPSAICEPVLDSEVVATVWNTNLKLVVFSKNWNWNVDFLCVAGSSGAQR